MTENNDLVLLENFCNSCGIDNSFVYSLEEYELIEITLMGNQKYLNNETIKEIEQIHYFHTELKINFEGIETIKNLLMQIHDLQNQLKEARRKIALLDL